VSILSISISTEKLPRNVRLILVQIIIWPQLIHKIDSSSARRCRSSRCSGATRSSWCSTRRSRCGSRWCRWRLLQIGVQPELMYIANSEQYDSAKFLSRF
jgi:hypothetical protein